MLTFKLIVPLIAKWSNYGMNLSKKTSVIYSDRQTGKVGSYESEAELAKIIWISVFPG